MATARALVLLAALTGATAVPLSGSIPIGLEARREFGRSDFIFPLADSEAEAENAGTVQPVGVGALPALIGEGASMTLFNVDACAYNLPHTHPRATEILFVIETAQDDSLMVEFSEENGGRTLSNFIGSGFLTFFPQGLTHFQVNLGCTESMYISGLNSEDGGVITIPSFSVAALDLDAVRVMFTLSEEEALDLIAGVPANPAVGLEECLTRCNITLSDEEGGGGGDDDDDMLSSAELSAAIVVPIVAVLGITGFLIYRNSDNGYGKSGRAVPSQQDVAHQRTAAALGGARPPGIPPPPAATTGARVANLPPGWQPVTADDGSVYFWNRNTGETSWDKPNAGGFV